MDLTSHGRGRWFEPSIAHSRRAEFCRQNSTAPKCRASSPPAGERTNIITERQATMTLATDFLRAVRNPRTSEKPISGSSLDEVLIETVWKRLRTDQAPHHDPRHRRVDKVLPSS